MAMEHSSVTKEEVARLKGLGFLQDKRYPDVFNVRVVTGNGKISAQKAHAIAEASVKFGSGEVAMTTRQTQEIQGVRYENADALIGYLKSFELETGGTGPKVRPVVSCKGTTCRFGLIDTYGLSEKIHNRFYQGWHDVKLPHKFKIAVGGCPNNCVKPDLNDLGVIGQKIPNLNPEICRKCAVCAVEKACPMGAAKMDNRLHVDSTACNHCGRCVKVCPFGVTEDAVCGYRIIIGGRWGKKGTVGKPLEQVFYSEEEVLDAIERVLQFYRSNGLPGERFADTVTRIGFDAVSAAILK